MSAWRVASPSSLGGPVQGLGVDFGQGLSELDEADGVAVPLRGVRLALEDGDGGGDARVLEPLLHLGLDDGYDAEVAQEELLEPEAVLGVQPADAGDESQVSAGLEQAGGVGEEVGVYVRPLGQHRLPRPLGAEQLGVAGLVHAADGTPAGCRAGCRRRRPPPSGRCSAPSRPTGVCRTGGCPPGRRRSWPWLPGGSSPRRSGGGRRGLWWKAGPGRRRCLSRICQPAAVRGRGETRRRIGPARACASRPSPGRCHRRTPGPAPGRPGCGCRRR